MAIRAGIIGGTGYGGAELLRLLFMHPEVALIFATSRGEAGKAINELWPSLSYIDLCYAHPDEVDYSKVDVVFSAAPNGVAMQHARAIVAAGAKLIDLSADFRFKDTEEFKRWYKMDHDCPELLADAIYGIPELFPTDIDSAKIIGCAGCYATCIQVAAAPAIEKGIYRAGSTIIADGKSGVSGAGRAKSVANLHVEVSENFRAYSASAHRHGPEIENGLTKLGHGEVDVIFVPHLLPMNRGIEATLYLKTNGASKEELQKAFEDYYAEKPFIEVLPWGAHPETRQVRGTNKILISLHQQEGSDMLIILAVEDNLIKGAAGQAVQLFNLAFGLNEELGLSLKPLAV